MYNKLFSKILDSSIWLEPDHIRLVWITFLAVMDQDGVVALSSIGNVANRARISDKQAEDAIKCLESPDIKNPDQDNEGRRIERIPGVGWFVINAEKYRDIIKAENAREQNRDRVFKHRQTQKAIAEQGHCACCRRQFEEPYSKSAALDHHHPTGIVRSYVCISCNKIIGQLENGTTCLDAKKKALAQAYIDSHTQRISRIMIAVGNAPVMVGHENVTPSDSEADTDTDTEREEAASPPAPTEPEWIDSENQMLAVYREFFPDASVPLFLQDVIRGRVENEAAWRLSLKFWKTNDYRALSVGKICDYYDEEVAGKHNGTNKKYGKRTDADVLAESKDFYANYDEPTIP